MACAVLEMLEQLLRAGELDRTREGHVVVRGPGLAPAAPTGGRQPAREPGQVQHLDLDGCPPQVAVVGTQEQAMEPPCAVVRSRNHGLPGRRARLSRRLPGETHRRERGCESEPDPARSRPAQLSHSPNSSAAFPARSTMMTPSRARPSRRISTRMNPLALRANRVLSSAVTRSM